MPIKEQPKHEFNEINEDTVSQTDINEKNFEEPYIEVGLYIVTKLLLTS